MGGTRVLKSIKQLTKTKQMKNHDGKVTRKAWHKVLPAMVTLFAVFCWLWPTESIAQDTWTVNVQSAGWGDGTTWQLRNSSNAVILSGGTYGNGYNDTQNVIVPPGGAPLEFFITAGGVGDNSPNYTVSCNGLVISGNIPGGSSGTFPGLICNGPPPPGTENWTVNVQSGSWGDGTTWQLRNSSNAVILSGGTYGNGYNDTQTIAVPPGGSPLEFFISSTFGDNRHLIQFHVMA
jgi:hypothetical protein